MTALTLPVLQAIDDSGVSIPLAELFVYAAGSTDERTAYADADFEVELSNPVEADSAGRFPPIFLKFGTYRVVLKTPGESAETIWEIDDFDFTDPGNVAAELETKAAQVADYTALKALGAAALAGLLMVGGARGGLFEIVEDTSENVMAALAEDPGEGVRVELTNGGGTKYARRLFKGNYHYDWWGVPTGLSSMAATARAAMQQAHDYMYLQGGGAIGGREETYFVDDEVYVWQRCSIVGEGNGFVSQYTSAAAKPKGMAIFLKGGAALSSGDGIVRFRLKGTWDAGAGYFRDAPLSGQEEGDRNSDYRHFGGIKGVTVWGNRSADQAPTAVDLNSNGHCVQVDGARYVHIEKCALMFAPQSNISFTSYDYGGGAVSSNNAFVQTNAILQSAGVGAVLAGGDSTFVANTVGYCGSTGVSIAAWGVVANNLIWNHVGAGVSISAAAEGPIFVGNKVYDNQKSGIILASGDTKALITGNTITRNNQAVNAGINERCGIFVGSTATANLVIVGNRIGNDGGSPPNTQDYGVYFNSSATICVLDGNDLSGNLVANLTLAAATNIRLHQNVGTNQPAHPGFVSDGDINMNGKKITAAQSFVNNAWATKTVATTTIACGNDTMITLNEAAPIDVTDLTTTLSGIPRVTIRQSGAANVTFKHNTAKLRLKSGADTVVGQYKSIELVYVSGTVWQEV